MKDEYKGNGCGSCNRCCRDLGEGIELEPRFDKLEDWPNAVKMQTQGLSPDSVAIPTLKNEDCFYLDREHGCRIHTGTRPAACVAFDCSQVFYLPGQWGSLTRGVFLKGLQRSCLPRRRRQQALELYDSLRRKAAEDNTQIGERVGITQAQSEAFDALYSEDTPAIQMQMKLMLRGPE